MKHGDEAEWRTRHIYSLKCSCKISKNALKRNKIITQELPHDGVALLQGLGTLGGVKHQPIDDVDLLPILLFGKERRKDRDIFFPDCSIKSPHHYVHVGGAK